MPARFNAVNLAGHFQGTMAPFKDCWLRGWRLNYWYFGTPSYQLQISGTEQAIRFRERKHCNCDVFVTSNKSLRTETVIHGSESSHRVGPFKYRSAFGACNVVWKARFGDKAV